MSEAVTLLRSIDASLKALLAARSGGASPPGSAARPASDRDLDSQYGNPIVKAKDPRDWTGETMNGRRFSECPPEYLDIVADRLDYFAEQAEIAGEVSTTTGKPTAGYKRLDAARARGWAKRVREGWKAPALSGFTADSSPIDDDDVPF